MIPILIGIAFFYVHILLRITMKINWEKKANSIKYGQLKNEYRTYCRILVAHKALSHLFSLLTFVLLGSGLISSTILAFASIRFLNTKFKLYPIFPIIGVLILFAVQNIMPAVVKIIETTEEFLGKLMGSLNMEKSYGS